MRLRQLPPCAGFDTAVPLTADLCKAFLDSGYKFVIRYTPHWADCVHDNPKPDYRGWFYGLSRSERDIILESGLALGLVQMMFQGVRLDYQTGKDQGANLVANARALDLPEGLTLWCDGEYRPASDRHVRAFLNGFGKPLAKADHPGLYWGKEGLTNEQLYGLPYFRSYWRAGMKYLVDPQPRSYCMYQTPDQLVHGIDVDLNLMTYDSKGDRPWFVVG